MNRFSNRIFRAASAVALLLCTSQAWAAYWDFGSVQSGSVVAGTVYLRGTDAWVSVSPGWLKIWSEELTGDNIPELIEMRPVANNSTLKTVTVYTYSPSASSGMGYNKTFAHAFYMPRNQELAGSQILEPNAKDRYLVWYNGGSYVSLQPISACAYSGKTISSACFPLESWQSVSAGGITYSAIVGIRFVPHYGGAMNLDFMYNIARPNQTKAAIVRHEWGRGFFWIQ